MNLAVFSTDCPTAALDKILAFCRTLHLRGFSIFAEPSLIELLRPVGDPRFLVSSPEIPEETDLAVSIGGDGTFLRTARRIGGRPIPIVGVNAGHLGFLTQYSLEEAPLLADQLLAGELIPEPRMLLKLTGASLPADLWPYALNEIAVLKEDSASMIDVDVYDREEYLADILADGLIISTPTGSTGYALSAGGPLISPDVEAIELLPVAPHTLTLRPILLAADAELNLYPTSRTNRCRVSVDGCSFPLKTPCELTVSRAPFALTLLRRPDESFFSTLRKKLLWAKR